MRNYGVEAQVRAGKPASAESGYSNLLPASRLAAPSFFEQRGHHEAVLRHIIQGVLPLKFAYAGSAARAHDALARSAGYQSVIGSVDDEVRALLALGLSPELCEDVIEIGPGNGEHSVLFLGAMAASGYPCRRYLGLDFSETLLRISGRRIRIAFDKAITVKGEMWDIESGPSRCVDRWRVDRQPVLTCLFGNTLGNLECAAAALRHVHDSLLPDDVLVVGLTLRPPDDSAAQVLAPYRSSVFSAAVLEPLKAAGIDLNDIELTIRYASGVVVGEVVFRRSVKVGETTVPAGHALRCFCSRRFTKDDVATLFDSTGWLIGNAALDSVGDHMVLTAYRGRSRCTAIDQADRITATGGHHGWNHKYGR